MELDKPISREEIYESKAQYRKDAAKLPLEVKLQKLLRLQHLNLELKKASSRKAKAFRPWDMTEEEFEAY